eukprot:763100-Hanusia_phi.AAC.4
MIYTIWRGCYQKSLTLAGGGRRGHARRFHDSLYIVAAPCFTSICETDRVCCFLSTDCHEAILLCPICGDTVCFFGRLPRLMLSRQQERSSLPESFEDDDCKSMFTTFQETMLGMCLSS